MPMTRFICPDGQETTIKACFESCRMGSRCATLPTLQEIGKTREWKGVPSTTQLLKGTREAYLEIITEFAASPDSFAFALVGSKAHAKLERGDAAGHLLEERLTEDEISGQFDLYDGETKTLFDYKTSGSYKVAKALGLEKIATEIETGEVYKTGERKGQQKTRKEYRFEKGEPDMADWIMQLNHYRLLLEGAGFPVGRMVIQCVTRDGGTFTAKSRGIDRNIYLIDVPRLPDDEVRSYFESKRDSLLFCLEVREIPAPCTIDENWQGRKCADYCHVWKDCELGRQAHATVAANTEGDAA